VIKARFGLIREFPIIAPSSFLRVITSTNSGLRGGRPDSFVKDIMIYIVVLGRRGGG